MDALILIVGDFMGGFKFKKNDVISLLDSCEVEHAIYRDRFWLIESRENVEIMKSLGLRLFYDKTDYNSFIQLILSSVDIIDMEDLVEDGCDGTYENQSIFKLIYWTKNGDKYIQLVGYIGLLNF